MRGQISLWMLSKFGMIFFIVALSSIILTIELSAKQNICRGQTQAIASEIAGRITQVLESPAEDEQRTYAFPGGLALGRTDRVRYLVQITDRKKSTTEQTSGRLIVNVTPASDPECQRSSSVPYARLNAVNLVPSGGRSAGPDPVGNTFVLNPSELDPNKKSYYLVILKCGNKCHPPGSDEYQRHIYIKDCTETNVETCSYVGGAGGPMNDKNLCGFITGSDTCT